MAEEDPIDILSGKQTESNYYPYRNKIVSSYQCFINLSQQRAT